MTSLHLHPFTAPLTKGHQGLATSFIAGAQNYLGVVSLSTDGVGIYWYLPINYITLHDEFMQRAFNPEPGTGQMYHWHHPLLPLLLPFLLGKNGAAGRDFWAHVLLGHSLPEWSGASPSPVAMVECNPAPFDFWTGFCASHQKCISWTSQVSLNALGGAVGGGGG